MPTLTMPQGVITETQAQEYIGSLQQLTAAIGPAVMLNAVQKVVSEEL